MDMTHDVETHTHNSDPPLGLTGKPKKIVVREDWTTERDAILVDERGRGTVRRVIADIINEKTGSHFTKAAICGRIDRLFPIAKPKKTEAEKAASREARRERDRLKKQRKREQGSPTYKARKRREYAAREKREIVCIKPAHTNGNGMRVYKGVVVAMPKLRCVEVEPRNLKLIDLETSDCRFPYGDSEITFCGHPVIDGSSYCGPHHGLCREKPLPHQSAGKPIPRDWRAA